MKLAILRFFLFSSFTNILITIIIFFVITAYLIRQNYLQKHPWLIELKSLKTTDTKT